MTAQRYISRPVQIEAIKWTGDLDKVPDRWRLEGRLVIDEHGDLIVDTLEGPARCRVGSYIVRGTAGEYYPVRGDIFENKYAEVVA